MHVENTSTDALSEGDRERVRGTLAFAEQLGAESIVVRAESIADEVVRECRRRNVSRVVLGRPVYNWRSRLRGTLVKALIRQAEGIEVLVTSGLPEGPPPRREPIGDQLGAPLREWIEAVGWVAAATVLVALFHRVLGDADRAMVYLLAVAVAATRVGGGPSLLAAFLGVAAFDFLFVPPRFTFAVSDLRYLVTFCVMLAVGVLVGRLTVRIRGQASSAMHRERRTAALYALSREFATETDPAAIARTTARHVRDHLASETVLWVRDESGLRALHGGSHAETMGDRELAVARWVLEHGRASGVGTDTLPYARALYLPLTGSEGTIGVLAVAGPPLNTDQRLLADTFARQSALALERAILASEAESARIAVETERLRNELLSAVSHDLRTPLASITGSATALIEQHSLDAAARSELLHTIREESAHLGRLVADLLDLTRIESGTVRARREWVPVEEVIDTALGRLENELMGRDVKVDVPEEMLTAPMDATLVGQVLLNLLENAAKHTPAGRPLEIVARAHEDHLRIEVLDRGNGIPPGEEERIFDKFYRTADGERMPGTGLGLAIARAVVRAHGGSIHAENREGGGARFVIELPLGRDSA
jgi:two-component system sensor histidine kinase KdpD